MSRPVDEKVVVGYLSPSLLHAAFHQSVVNLLVHDMAMNQRIVHGGGLMHVQAGANLAGPRNGLVKQFLAGHGRPDLPEADWLWMVDSDMTFPPDTLERLLEHADPDPTSEHYAPVVGGLCFGFDDKADVQPTLFGLAGTEDDPKVIRYHEWKPDAMFQVAATGTACLLVHKSALEAIRDVQLPQRGGKPGFNSAFPWFQETEHGGTAVSEDITFCWRAGLLDIPIYVNTAVQLGHIKDRELTIDTYLAQRGMLQDQTFGALFKDVKPRARKLDEMKVGSE